MVIMCFLLKKLRFFFFFLNYFKNGLESLLIFVLFLKENKIRRKIKLIM